MGVSGAHATASGGSGAATYASAGVDIEAGEAAVELIRRHVASTERPGVMGTIGGFGGCFSFDTSRYREPVLVSSTDGVGTKALVAASTARFDTIGIDLVAMCVDDLVCVGAEPMFLLDYIATGRIDPEQMEMLVSGIAAGCRQANCALLGGEMAEHAGVLAPGHFDLVGFAVGAVERDSMLGHDLVCDGDVLVGIASPGLRSNGYTLARHVLFDRSGLDPDAPAWAGADHSLADELLHPSLVYAPAVLEAVRSGSVHAAAHVTGGGLAGNLKRVLAPDTAAVLERGSWPVPRIFEEIRRLGDVPEPEMERVFNMGIGMVLVVERDGADTAVGALEAAGHEAYVIGAVTTGSGEVETRGVS